MKNTTTDKSKKAEANPYLSGKQAWNNVMTEMSHSRNIWMVIGLIGVLTGLTAIGGITYIGSQSKIVPYIVEVDKHGETFVAGVVEKRMDAEEQIYKALVANFINNTRRVTSDFNLQRDNILKVYSYVNQGDPSQQKLHNWFNPNDGKHETPFQKGQRGETTDISVQSILQLSPSSWQIDWLETSYSNKGVTLMSDSYRAVLDLYQLELDSNNLNDVINNPLNIFVKDFRWTTRQ